MKALTFFLGAAISLTVAHSMAGETDTVIRIAVRTVEPPQNARWLGPAYSYLLKNALNKSAKIKVLSDNVSESQADYILLGKIKASSKNVDEKTKFKVLLRLQGADSKQETSAIATNFSELLSKSLGWLADKTKTNIDYSEEIPLASYQSLGEGLIYLEKSEGIAPAKAEESLLKAIQSFRNSFEKADIFWEHAHSLEYDARLRVIGLASGTGKAKSFQKECLEALKKDSLKYPWLTYDLGNLHLEFGMANEALDDFERIEKISGTVHKTIQWTRNATLAWRPFSQLNESYMTYNPQGAFTAGNLLISLEHDLPLNQPPPRGMPQGMVGSLDGGKLRSFLEKPKPLRLAGTDITSGKTSWETSLGKGVIAWGQTADSAIMLYNDKVVKVNAEDGKITKSTPIAPALEHKFFRSGDRIMVGTCSPGNSLAVICLKRSTKNRQTVVMRYLIFNTVDLKLRTDQTLDETNMSSLFIVKNHLLSVPLYEGTPTKVINMETGTDGTAAFSADFLKSVQSTLKNYEVFSSRVYRFKNGYCVAQSDSTVHSLDRFSDIANRKSKLDVLGIGFSSAAWRSVYSYSGLMGTWMKLAPKNGTKGTDADMLVYSSIDRHAHIVKAKPSFIESLCTKKVKTEHFPVLDYSDKLLWVLRDLQTVEVYDITKDNKKVWEYRAPTGSTLSLPILSKDTILSYRHGSFSIVKLPSSGQQGRKLTKSAILVSKSRAYSDLRQLDKAKASMDQALKLDSSSVEVNYAMSQISLKTGEHFTGWNSAESFFEFSKLTDWRRGQLWKQVVEKNGILCTYPAHKGLLTNRRVRLQDELGRLLVANNDGLFVGDLMHPEKSWEVASLPKSKDVTILGSGKDWVTVGRFVGNKPDGPFDFKQMNELVRFDLKNKNYKVKKIGLLHHVISQLPFNRWAKFNRYGAGVDQKMDALPILFRDPAKDFEFVLINPNTLEDVDRLNLRPESSNTLSPSRSSNYYRGSLDKLDFHISLYYPDRILLCSSFLVGKTASKDLTICCYDIGKKQITWKQHIPKPANADGLVMSNTLWLHFYPLGGKVKLIQSLVERKGIACTIDINSGKTTNQELQSQKLEYEHKRILTTYYLNPGLLEPQKSINLIKFQPWFNKKIDYPGLVGAISDDTLLFRKKWVDRYDVGYGVVSLSTPGDVLYQGGPYFDKYPVITENYVLVYMNDRLGLNPTMAICAKHAFFSGKWSGLVKSKPIDLPPLERRLQYLRR